MTGGNHIITAALSSPHLRSGAPGLGSISHVAAQPFSQPLDHSGCGNTDWDGFKAIHCGDNK